MKLKLTSELTLMKDKNIAGILALFLGGFGVHQFYLNQPGMGIAHFFFIWNRPLWMFSWLFAWATAISLFTMDQEKFDRKYNKKYADRRYRDRETDFDRRGRDYREERYEERRHKREEEARRRRRREDQKRYDYSKSKQKPKRTKANPYKQSGISKFKEYDYEGAVEDFIKSLEIAPDDIATHFNLACAYSLSEEADKAFEHLDKAVGLGFKDVKKIKEHDALAYIRIQDEFENFENNGFRLKAQTAQKAEEPKEDLLSTTPDLLDQLKKLGELRDKGLLTEAEFTAQKEKLLKK